MNTFQRPQHLPRETGSPGNRHNIAFDENSDDSDTLDNPPLPSVVPRTGRKSVTSDLFHQWLTSPPKSPGIQFACSYN